MVATVKHSSSNDTRGRKPLANYRLIHFLEYERTFARSWAIKPEDTTSNAEKMQRVKEGLLHKNRPHDELDMSQWGYAS